MLTIEFIEKVICEKRGILPKDLHVKYRGGNIVFIRQLIMFFAMKHGYSEFCAASYFERDHTTAYHVKIVIRNRYETEKDVRDEVNYYDSLFSEEGKKRRYNYLIEQARKLIEEAKKIRPLETSELLSIAV